MNDVRPFVGQSFEASRVGRVADCLAQPYDVINSEQRAAYVRRSPFNIVNLTLGETRPGDGETENVYTRARATLDGWIAGGALAPSAAESLWLYEQRFTVDGRSLATRGVLARVRLADFAERRILPHEKVMAKPVEDRMRLTLATETQLEPIWGFYRDPTLDIAPLAQGTPVLDWLEPGAGVSHRVWQLSDRRLAAEVTGLIGKREIYIADGHHRYQTMLNVRDELRRRHPAAGPDAPWEFILMYLVNAERETLAILPYHRVVADVPADGSMLERLRRSFAVERTVDWRRGLSDAGREGQAFAVALAGDPSCYILSRRGGSGKLDVELLNDAVLRDAIGLTEEDLRLGRGVEYAHDAEAALAQVAKGAGKAAFLLNPTRLAEIERCAASGGVMPRKSSFFYPKPLSGIVLYPMRRG